MLAAGLAMLLSDNMQCAETTAESPTTPAIDGDDPARGMTSRTNHFFAPLFAVSHFSRGARGCRMRRVTP